jgi:hypothetical protein
MPHLSLLGDSILDNAQYTDGGPAVHDHLKRLLPTGWTCDLIAVDGAVTCDIQKQIARLPEHSTHIALSVGGNDLIECIDILDTPVKSSAEALLLLANECSKFRDSYRKAIAACLSLRLPLTICTIYNCNFPSAAYQKTVEVALAVFNNEIITAAVENMIQVVELRLVCSEPADYANPIEPSVQGGEKIAQALLRAVIEGSTDGWGTKIAA